MKYRIGLLATEIDVCYSLFQSRINMVIKSFWFPASPKSKLFHGGSFPIKFKVSVTVHHYRLVCLSNLNMIVWVSEVPNRRNWGLLQPVSKPDYQSFSQLLCWLLHSWLKRQCGQQFYSEPHLLDLLMTGFMSSNQLQHQELQYLAIPWWI